MGKSELKVDRSPAVNQESVENLVEEIRLISLNMAIMAAKLKITGESRTIIRKKISELVNLSLDTINRLARVLKVMRSGTGSEEIDPITFAAELKEIETMVSARSTEIIQLLIQSEKDI